MHHFRNIVHFFGNISVEISKFIQYTKQYTTDFLKCKVLYFFVVLCIALWG